MFKLAASTPADVARRCSAELEAEALSSFRLNRGICSALLPTFCEQFMLTVVQIELKQLTVVREV